MFKHWPYFAAFAILTGYCAWISGPYLRSVLVRDAAITTWSNSATAPISGTISFEPIGLSGKVGEDGRLATVVNNHISEERVNAAELRVSLAKARLMHAEDLLAEIISLENDRRTTKSDYADIFRQQLDVVIENLNSEISINEERLEVIRSIAARKQQLASRGTGSVGAADEELLRLTDIQLEIERLRSRLDFAMQRRLSAEHGTFIDADGNDPGWVRGNRLELKLEKKKARHVAREMKIELENAGTDLKKSRLDMIRLSTGKVSVPPGGILWRRQAVSGMSVSAGDPVAEWIDCSRLFVDMPVSDAEASLISEGDTADVVLEGEDQVREAEVVLIRGSAAVLGRDELVSLAKGRTEDKAQVLLRLNAKDEDFPSCPVGRAAYVDFEGVGVLDVLRARLRI